MKSLLLPPLPFHPFYLCFPFPFPSTFPSFPLEVSRLNTAIGVCESAVRSPSGIWGRANGKVGRIAGGAENGTDFSFLVTSNCCGGSEFAVRPIQSPHISSVPALGAVYNPQAPRRRRFGIQPAKCPGVPPLHRSAPKKHCAFAVVRRLLQGRGRRANGFR